MRPNIWHGFPVMSSQQRHIGLAHSSTLQQEHCMVTLESGSIYALVTVDSFHFPVLRIMNRHMHQCVGRYSRSQLLEQSQGEGMYPVFDIQIPPPSLKRTQRGNELPIEEHLSPEPISPVRPKSVGPKATHRRGDVVRQDNGRGRLSCFFSMKKKRKQEGAEKFAVFYSASGVTARIYTIPLVPRSVRPGLCHRSHF